MGDERLDNTPLYHSFGPISYSCHHKISPNFCNIGFECDCLRTMYNKGRESFALLVYAHVSFCTQIGQNMKINFSMCTFVCIFVNTIEW